MNRESILIALQKNIYDRIENLTFNILE